MIRASVEDARIAAGSFALPGPVQSVEPYGTGLIHDSFRVSCALGDGASRRFLLQRINPAVFPDPRAVMDNIVRVTRHLHAQMVREQTPDPDRRTLTVLPSADGAGPVGGPPGDRCWRCYAFIEGMRTVETLASPEQARACARAFADFQRRLADLPPPPLMETIPHFHDTPRRLEALGAAAGADAVGRAGEVAADLAFALAQGRLAGELECARRAGRLPVRVVHNDTKINNLLFDAAEGAPRCVVDLDTVMPGLSATDFGDLVRAVITPLEGEESNSPDLPPLRFDWFEALVEGFLDGARGFLLPEEVRLLSRAGSVITLELGIRFLTDYLSGDRYFKTVRPGQNRDRARSLFRLVQAMEQEAGEMERIVARAYRRASAARNSAHSGS